VIPGLFKDAVDALGGLGVSVFVTASKVRGLNPAENDDFLRTIKIRSTTFFGRKVKPSVPCRKIL
jgi:hypothetical protein